MLRFDNLFLIIKIHYLKSFTFYLINELMTNFVTVLRLIEIYLFVKFFGKSRI